MKLCVLSLLLCCGAAHTGPPQRRPAEQGSCADPGTAAVAELALSRVNADRGEGHVLSLHRLHSARLERGPDRAVFHLTLDVLETTCHALSGRDWRGCGVRRRQDTPVYGQCKATAYTSGVQRVVRVSSYNCTLRPDFRRLHVLWRNPPRSKIFLSCPDCPRPLSVSDDNILRAVNETLQKYNRESGMPNYFSLLAVTRASLRGGLGLFYLVEFTIQETVCSNSSDVADVSRCALMDSKSAHKGHCRGSHSQLLGQDNVSVSCEIFEPAGSETEKGHHLLGGEGSHSLDHGLGHQHQHQHLHLHGDAAAAASPAPSKGLLGTVQYLPALDRPMAFPPSPDGTVASDELPGVSESGQQQQPPRERLPVPSPFPGVRATECPGEPRHGDALLQELFQEDPLFYHPVDIAG